MLKNEVRLTEERDIADLVANLSVESTRGLGVLGLDPTSILRQGLDTSEQTLTLLIDGKIAAIAGIIKREWYGQFWFNTSKVVVAHPREFLRGAKEIFAKLSGEHKIILNECYEENFLTLSLAQHFGFKIVATRARGKQGELFHLVAWEAP